MERTKLTLSFIGTDKFSRDVYRSENGELVVNTNIRFATPSWYTKYRNEFEGEPDLPLPEEHYDVFVEEWPDEVKGKYMLLDKIRCGCEFFLGFGHRNPDCLHTGNVKDEIAMMRKLYDSLPAKPVWLTEEDIDRYEEKMTTN